jgi:hypothetical protein
MVLTGKPPVCRFRSIPLPQLMALRLLFTFFALMIDTVMFTIHFSDPKMVPGTTALTFSPDRSEESHTCKLCETAVPGSIFRFLAQNFADPFQTYCELHQKCLVPGGFLN